MSGISTPGTPYSLDQINAYIQQAQGGMTYASGAVLQVSVPNAAASVVSVLGYSTPGDGGAATYNRVSSQPAHPGFLVAGDGSFWELATDKPSPAHWGGKKCDPSAYLTAIEAHLALPLDAPTLTALTAAWTAFAASAFDNSAMMTKAITYATAKNTVAYAGEGHWYFASAIDPYAGVRGAGMDATFLWWPPNNRLFSGTGATGSASPWRRSLTFSDLTLHGPLAGNYNRDSNGNPTGGNNNDEPAKVSYYQNVVVKNVRSTWSKDTGMFITWCGQLTVSNYYPEYTARDGMYTAGITNVAVNGYYRSMLVIIASHLIQTRSIPASKRRTRTSTSPLRTIIDIFLSRT